MVVIDSGPAKSMPGPERKGSPMKHPKPATFKGHRAHIFDLQPDPEEFVPEDGFENLSFAPSLPEEEFEGSSITWDEELSRETHQEVSNRSWRAGAGRWSEELEEALQPEETRG